jgi:hypothetical protein
MQPIRPIAASISILLFAVTGLVTYFAMDRSDYFFCDKRLDIKIATLVALGVLTCPSAFGAMRVLRFGSGVSRCFRTSSWSPSRLAPGLTSGPLSSAANQ